MISNMVERVKPELRDGIEFYVSADKSIAGCSQSGLARLAGVGESSIRRLIDFYSQEAVRQESPDYRLKALLQEPYYLGIQGTKNAKILREEVCVALLEYYAYRSPVRNETALYSYRKFAAMGWHNWVLSVTGHSPATSGSMDSNDIADELAAIRREIRQLGDVREEAKKSHPGLVALVEGYGRSKPNIPKGLRNPFSYAEWAECCGYDPGDHFLVRRIAEHVKALRGKRELRKLDGRNVYFYADLPAFESAVEGLALKRNQALLKEQIEPKRV